MKKFYISILFLFLLTTCSGFAEVDKNYYEYLKNKKHFAIFNPFAEKYAENIIKKSLEKETGGKYKIKFDGYTISSMKKGIFKDLLIEGSNIKINAIDIPFLKVQTATDYNYINIEKKPLMFESDTTLCYELHLNETSLNQALNLQEYYKTLNKINDIAYPLFIVYNVDARIINDKINLDIEYNFPILPSKRNKKFTVTTNFKAENENITATEIYLDKAYGNIKLNKVANLVNLLNPVSFTLSVLEANKCKGKVENVKIEDNIVKINGKIYIKGEK